MGISNDVLSETILAILPEVQMALTRTVPFLQMSRQLGKIHSYGDGNSIQSGSYKLRVPIEVAESTVTTALSGTGYETIDLSTQDATRYAEFSWGQWARPVTISEVERSQNMGDAAVAEVAKTRVENAMGALKRDINRQIISATNNAKYGDLGTLNGFATGGIATGFMEALAAGSQTNVVGGLSKATYQSVPGWQNQFGDASGNFATNGIPRLRNIRTAISLNREMAKDDKLFHLVLFNPKTFDLYESAMYTNARFVNTKDLDSGAYRLMFDGTPCFPDPGFFSTNSGTTAVGTPALSAYLLNLDGIQLAVHRKHDFNLTPFLRVPNQLVDIAYVTFFGGLIAKNLGSSGVLVDAVA